MNALELKNNIFGLLININNNEKLADIYQYLQEFITDEAEPNLSAEQELILDEAIAQTDDASKLISHAEAMKMMQSW